MPLNRKMVWPDWVDGAGGTTQVVLKDVSGCPVVLVQLAKVIQPLPSAGLTSVFGTKTFAGISGCCPALASITPRSAMTWPVGLTFLIRPASICNEWPASIRFTTDFGL